MKKLKMTNISGNSEGEFKEGNFEFIYNSKTNIFTIQDAKNPKNKMNFREWDVLDIIFCFSRMLDEIYRKKGKIMDPLGHEIDYESWKKNL